MPEPGLDDLDVGARCDEQTGEVVAQIVVPETVRQRCRDSGSADSDFNGNVTIGDKIVFTASSGALQMGALTLTGPLDADGQTIDGAAITGSSLATTGDGIVIAGDLIDFGGRYIGSSPAFGGSIFITAATVEVGTDLRVSGDAYASNFIPYTVPTITGSRGGNVALADLLASLAGLGLVVDSTTA